MSLSCDGWVTALIRGYGPLRLGAEYMCSCQKYRVRYRLFEF
jgi:hypothetical protein